MTLSTYFLSLLALSPHIFQTIIILSPTQQRLLPMILQSTESFECYEFTQRLECRICLQEIALSTSPPYCQCKGNHKNVHEKCLKEWAQHTNKFRDEQSRIYFNCDLCRSKIYIRYNSQCAVKTCPEIRSEFQQNWCKIILIILVFTLFLVVLVVSVHSLRDGPDNWIVFVTLIIISTVMVLSTLPLMLLRLVVKKVRVIEGFHAGVERGKGNRIANSFSETQLNL